MAAQPPRVVATVKTFRRAALLRRMLQSLECAPEITGVIVVADAGDAESARVAGQMRQVRACVQCDSSVGQGAGHALGIGTALHDPHATHVLLLDDDVVLRPGALAELLRGLQQAEAGTAVPLFVNAAGHVGWFPGVIDRWVFRVLREPNLTAAEFQRRCGAAPMPFTWSPWPTVLVTRDTLEKSGPPRDDFGFMGDDLEFTLRLSYRRAAVLVPSAVVEHLTPGRNGGPESYFVDCLHLQNLAYLSLHLPHGARARRHLPGGVWRFLRPRRFRPRAVSDAARALWRGGVRGRPAGAPRADQYWREYQKARAR